MGGRGMKDVGGAVLAGSSPPFLGRERAAVDVDVGPERRSPRYHETCLALESIKEGSAAVSEPRCVWLRVHIVKDLEKARRLPVRVEEQQAQQLAMNPPRSAGDGRQTDVNFGDAIFIFCAHKKKCYSRPNLLLPLSLLALIS